MWQTPLLAFSFTTVLHVAALILFPRLGLLDFPERYGLARERLPYPSGIIPLAVFLGFYAALEQGGPQKIGLIAAILILGIFCFIDDRRPLPALPRLLVQIAAAGLLFLTGSCVGGRVCSLTNPIEGFIGNPLIELNGSTSLTIDGPTWLTINGSLPLLSIIVTVGWLLLTINALNWFDGIPGQVSVLSTIGFLTIGFLSLSSRVDQPHLALLAYSLAAIACACLLFDFPPPRVVSGDTGAMFLGLMLGVLTIYAGGKVATAFLVLGVPLIDSIIVTLRRVIRGLSPFRGAQSGEHLHHRLLAKGWSPRAVILLNALLGSSFGITALFLNTTEKFIAALLLFLIMLGLSWYSAPHKIGSE